MEVPIVNFPSDHRAVVSSFTVAPFIFGDFDGDLDVDAADWSILRSGQHTDLSGMTGDQAYAMGDLNSDLRNNHDDFVLFKSAFDQRNGVGTFSAMVASVPEPGSLALLGIGALAVGWRRRAVPTPIPRR